MNDIKNKYQREINHGQSLAAKDTEFLWGWSTSAGRLRAHRRAKLISEVAGLKPSMTVLEIGCGTGNFTELFAKSGAKIVAIDISPDLLAKAKDRCLPEEQISFINDRFEDSRVPGPFDAVIGSSVLHHLDLAQALPRAYDLLVPGGKFCFAEPNMANPQVFLERKFRWLYPYVSPDETAFLRWTLRTSLLQVGFRDVEITPFDWLHPAVPASFIRKANVLGMFLERIPGLREFAGSLLIHARKP